MAYAFSLRLSPPILPYIEKIHLLQKRQRVDPRAFSAGPRRLAPWHRRDFASFAGGARKAVETKRGVQRDARLRPGSQGMVPTE